MRQVNIKSLKANLCKELLDLPVSITRYGQVIAVISGHNSDDKVVTTKDKVTTKHKVVTNDMYVKQFKRGKCNVWVNPLANSSLAPKAKA